MVIVTTEDIAGHGVTLYKPPTPKPPAGWRRAGERFVDGAAGRTVEVSDDPQSGQRQCVDRS